LRIALGISVVLAAAAPVAAAPAALADDGTLGAAWSEAAAQARMTQPHWSSPLVTTTGVLEQRVRFDLQQQHAGNGTHTTLLDGGRGLDLIVAPTTEVQLAAPPYAIRTGPPGTSLAGFGDWPFLRVEQRLASSPEAEGDYVVTVWLQVLAPSGIAHLGSGTWQFLPTLAGGKGWGAFDVQATLGAVIPAAHADVIGHQVQGNVAFQYRLGGVFWPELEVNWTHYADGARTGLDQVYLTPGLVVGRFALNESVQLTFGGGYQVAVAPPYRAKPLTPAADHAWLVTSRLNF
jgi:hypothetical protein